MKLGKLDKRGQTGVNQLPQFFQVMLLVVVFVGLTFIVLDKFVGVSYHEGIVGTPVTNETITALNDTVGDYLSKYNLRDSACTVILVTNVTSKLTIGTGNYTMTNCLIKGTSTSTYLNQNVNVSYNYKYTDDTIASNAINDTTANLYDYGVGFLGIIILVTMVYLIISIVSGRRQGAK